VVRGVKMIDPENCEYCYQDMCPTGAGEWLCGHPDAPKSKYSSETCCEPEICPLEEVEKY
jgi:hypothetical protein